MRLLERLLATPQVGEVRQEFLALQREASSGGIKPSTPLYARLGIGLYLLGHAREAEMTLSRVTGDAVAAFYRGLALGSLEKHAEAAERFAEAGKLGYDRVECAMRRAGEIRAQGQLAEAEALLAEHRQRRGPPRGILVSDGLHPLGPGGHVRGDRIL